MNRVNEGFLKKALIMLTAVCRLLLFLSVLVIHNVVTPTTDDEFRRMLFSIVPLTALYFSFFVSYIRFYRRYFFPGECVSIGYLILSCMPVLLLHAAELVLILNKGWVLQSEIVNDMDSLYTYIAVLEAGLAIHTGILTTSILTGKKMIN